MNRVLSLLLLLVALLGGTAQAAEQSITLGIYAYRPKAIIEDRYQALADRLSAALKGVSVRLKALQLNELEAAIKANQVDLVLTNPRHYILLRSENSLSGAIATLNKRGFDGSATHSLGGVIFTRAARSDINTLQDLHGLTIATASTRHMGGYQCQAYELLQAGIHVTDDDRLLETGSHDATVQAVLDGRADVGFVRTEILEDLAHNGRLDLHDVKVINRQVLAGFPFISSTRLYPEWPVVALPHLDADLVRRVSASLLSLEADDPAAIKAGIVGFVPPSDYLAVDTFARALRLPPYDEVAPVTWQVLWGQHRDALIIGAIALLAVSLLSGLLLNRHLRLRASNLHLADALNHQRRQRAAERLLATAATQLLEADAGNRDKALDLVLAAAGAHLGVDRTYIFEIDTERREFSNTHEWCKPGIPPARIRSQRLPIDAGPWWYERLQQDGILVIDAVDDLGSGASAVRRMLQRRGVRSLCVAPLLGHGRIRGLIGGDSVRTLHRWPDEEIQVLKMLAAALSSAFERWRAEIAVQESEIYFRTLFESSADGILIADSGTRRLAMANPAMCDMLGYSVEELTRMSVVDIHPAERLDDVLQGFEAQTQRQVHLIESVPVQRRDGSVFLADIDTSVLEVKGRKYLLGLFRDTTARRQAEDELRLLHFALDQTEEAAYLLDDRGHLQYVNEGAARMLGFSRDELLGMNVWEVDAHFEAAEWPAHFEALREAGSLTFEREHRRRDGSSVEVEVNANYLEYGEGHFNLAFARDISARKAIETARQESEQRLSLAGRAAFDLIYEWDPQAATLRWFGDVDRLLGYPPGTLTEHLPDWRAHIHPDDVSGFDDCLNARRLTAQLSECEYRVQHKDGRWRSWNDRALPVLDEDGRAGRWIGVCADVTERREANERLRLAASVFTHALEGIMITDATGTIIEANEAFTTITGYPRDEVLGRNPRFLQSGHHSPEFYQALWQDLAEHDAWSGEMWNRRRNGELFAESLTISTVRNARGEIRNFVGLFSDITAYKHHERQLEHIAHYDPLTDLPNRMLLGDRLRQAMVQARRQGRYVALVYLDLDGFKQINDTHGHDAGDRMLVTLSQRLRDAVREGDTIARLGGDEFVAVLADLDRPAATAPVLDRLLAAASKPVNDDGLDLHVSASLGVTYYPQDPDVDADQLLRQADQAMYQAKVAGKNRYALFDGSSQQHGLHGRFQSLDAIRDGLRDGEFELFYQPKVQMRSGAVVGVEALVRWNHPVLGQLLPGEFLPAIEGHPLEVQLDDWAIRTALAQITAWSEAGHNITVSVNVGATQLQEGDFLKKLKAMLAQFPKVPPRRLSLEILETNALADHNRISRIIHACREIGIQFALDDFGTGYSSLAYLKNLPASDLKIDQSFVHDMLHDLDDLAILDGIIGLATAFRRRVIAEGVETIEHGETLLQLGCELGQGIAIAAPMSADALPDWITSWRPPEVWARTNALSRTDLPIVFAAVEHRAWLQKVIRFVNGEGLAFPPLEIDTCRFNQWLDSDGRAQHGAHPLFVSLERHHTELHVQANELIELTESGHQGMALQGLDRLRATSAEMLLALRGLLAGAR